MCTTTNSAALISCGSLDVRAVTASTPPADAPITTIEQAELALGTKNLRETDQIKCKFSTGGQGSVRLASSGSHSPHSRLPLPKSLHVFDASPGIEEHDTLIEIDLVLLDESLERRKARTALGSGENPLGRSDFLHCAEELRIRHAQGGSARLPDRVEYQKIPYRLWNSKSGRDSCCVRKHLRESLARLECAHDGGAPGRLNRDHPRTLLSNPAHLLHLIERLPHSHESGSATGRIHDDVGQCPVEEFRELIAERLLSFHAVRLLEG